MLISRFATLNVNVQGKFFALKPHHTIIWKFYGNRNTL